MYDQVGQLHHDRDNTVDSKYDLAFVMDKGKQFFFGGEIIRMLRIGVESRMQMESVEKDGVYHHHQHKENGISDRSIFNFCQCGGDH